MISPDLPAALKSTLEGRLHGQSRQDAGMRAARISQSYRSGGNSGTIASAADALAYAVVRMPATYAAVAACLNALSTSRPDFAPASLLDIGAGPGTATFAAAEAFASLSSFAALDANPHLRDLALDLAGAGSRRLDINYTLGPALSLIQKAGAADLVIASYVIGELSERDRHALVAQAWASANDTLLLVEPGTPAGYQRILGARAALIADGAHVVAPCPHHQPCPIDQPDSSDWCHFVQRLQRSRAHKQVKGADVPFEDEKFIYLAVSRQPAAQRPSARVLMPPVIGKVAISAKLCCADGAARMTAIPRRDKAAFAAARRWDWGDGIDLPK